jgi:small subunit ribosomal protein S20
LEDPLANVPSAEKRNRQRIKRRARNLQHIVTMRTRVKRARNVIADTKSSSEDIQESVLAALRQLARAASKGVIHKRTAARKISRLTLALNKSAVDRNAASSATPKKTVKHKPSAKAAKAAEVKAPAKAPAKAAEVKAPAKAESKAPAKKADEKAAATKAPRAKKS